MKYALFLGCVAEDSCKELGSSMSMVAKKLGMNFVDIEDATCCGAGYLHAYNKQLSLLLNGRSLAMAEKAGVDTIITVCSLCLLALEKVNKELSSDPDALKKTNELLGKVGLHYSGKIKVKHFLQVLLEDYGIEKLSKMVVSPLNLKVAPFYSCQLIRPPDMHEFDNFYEPKSLDELIKALGGTPVNFPGKTKCCGFHILMVNEEVAMKMGGTHLKDAKDRGADCMVVPCPCCHLVFDMYQPRIESKLDMKIKLPILHLPQMIGLALGFTSKELGLNRHIVDASKLGAKMAVAEAS
jgi:succinate dehydrogenase / fumarate reductase cytochrome b subunit